MKQQLEQLKENSKSFNLKIEKLDNTNDTGFKTLTALIKDYNLENEFTAIALNNLLVEIGLAKKIQITTYYIKFKNTSVTTYTNSNKNKGKVNLIDKHYFINSLVPLARQKGIKRKTKL